MRVEGLSCSRPRMVLGTLMSVAYRSEIVITPALDLGSINDRCISFFERGS